MKLEVSPRPPAAKTENPPLKTPSKKTLLRSLAAAALLLVLAFWAGFFFSRQLLCVTAENPARPADVLVALGGEPQHRPPRAAQIYAQGAAPLIIVSGTGDCEDVQNTLLAKGVPAAAIRLECDSRTTQQNAIRSIPMLRALGAKRVILVTSWFHSRRALNCFRHYAPDIEFISLPTTADLPKSHWPARYERRWVALEYLKYFYYWLRFGIPPW